MSLGIANKIQAELDDSEPKQRKPSRYGISGYFLRPHYEHFDEYDSTVAYGTAYNPKYHIAVLKKWRNDLQNKKKYNEHRVKKAIKVLRMSATNAIEEYEIMHGEDELSNAMDARYEWSNIKGKKKLKNNRMRENFKSDMEKFNDTYTKHIQRKMKANNTSNKQTQPPPHTPTHSPSHIPTHSPPHSRKSAMFIHQTSNNFLIIKTQLIFILATGNVKNVI